MGESCNDQTPVPLAHKQQLFKSLSAAGCYSQYLQVYGSRIYSMKAGMLAIVESMPLYSCRT